MLLCAASELKPGMIVGAAVPDPRRADRQLIAPRMRLTDVLIDGLRSHDVRHVWVHYAGTEDLDVAAAGDLSFVQQSILISLRDRFARKAVQTVTSAGAQHVRGMVMELVTELMANRIYAGLVSRLFTREDALFAHAANVAYFSIIIGLETQSYIIRERSRLDTEHARDLTPLGIGAIFHDIGKLRGDARVRTFHEASDPSRPPEGYRFHTAFGREMLLASRAPASALQAVLMHHQRFDGNGWPSARLTGFDEPRPLRGHEIHVFSRIVAVANVLDNLISASAARAEPPALALARFASHLHDGWFDPVLHRAALRAIPPFPIGARVHLSDDTAAVVVTPNRDHPCRPIVRPLDATDPDHIIDLTDRLDLRIATCMGQDVTGIEYTVPMVPGEDEATQQDYYRRAMDRRRIA